MKGRDCAWPLLESSPLPSPHLQPQRLSRGVNQAGRPDGKVSSLIRTQERGRRRCGEDDQSATDGKVGANRLPLRRAAHRPGSGGCTRRAALQSSPVPKAHSTAMGSEEAKKSRCPSSLLEKHGSVCFLCWCYKIP